MPRKKKDTTLYLYPTALLRAGDHTRRLPATVSTPARLVAEMCARPGNPPALTAGDIVVPPDHSSPGTGGLSWRPTREPQHEWERPPLKGRH